VHYFVTQFPKLARRHRTAARLGWNDLAHFPSGSTRSREISAFPSIASRIQKARIINGLYCCLRLPSSHVEAERFLSVACDELPSCEADRGVVLGPTLEP